MSVKNTTIGQLLGAGALAFTGYQLYKRYAGNQGTKQEFQPSRPTKPLKQDEDRLDHMLEDTFPASDPLPLSRSGTLR